MAGHPQENSWTQQGHGYSQSAPGYGPVYEQQEQQVPYPPQGQGYEQPPGSYEQQPGSYEQTQVFEPQPGSYEQGYQQPGYDHPGAYDQQAVYGQPPTVYDQTVQAAQYDPAGQQPQYHPAGQQPPQPYSGQPQQALPPGQAPGQPGQGWGQWRQPKRKAARPVKPARGAGFVASLFDFGFTSFVTPKIIKALYALVTAWTLLWAVLFFFIGLHNFHVAGALFVLFIIDPILVLVSLGVLRVVLEFFMVTFRMQEDLRALRERGAGAPEAAGATGTAGTAGTAGDEGDAVTSEVSPTGGV